MKTLPHLLTAALLLWNCSPKPSTDNAPGTDSVMTTTGAVTDASAITDTESTTESSVPEEGLTADEVYGDVSDDFQGDYDDSNDLTQQDENGLVHFVTSRDYESQTFPVSLFNENDNAVEDVPAFLRSQGIKYNLEKTEADPNYDESTDVYVYTFGESVIEISYGDVNAAAIYSPEIELQDGVKVGMTKEDFVALFPQLQPYSEANEYQLHPYPFARFCFMTFYFEDGKIKSIKLEIAPQDCG